MSAALFVLALVTVQGSWGDDYIAGNCARFPDGCVHVCVRATEIAEGDPAPCGGILIPDEWAEQMAENKIGLKRCEELSKHQATVCKIELSAMGKRLAASDTARADASELAREAAELERPAPWYLRPSFVAPAAFVAGIVLGLTARQID